MNKIETLVERGEGYYCFRKPTVEEHPPPVGIDEDAGMPDPPSFDAVDVYRPVTVEVDDNGEPYAYHHDSDAPAETDGKVYVSLEHVYVKPLAGYDTPAHKVGE